MWRRRRRKEKKREKKKKDDEDKGRRKKKKKKRIRINNHFSKVSRKNKAPSRSLIECHFIPH